MGGEIERGTGVHRRAGNLRRHRIGDHVRPDQGANGYAARPRDADAQGTDRRLIHGGEVHQAIRCHRRAAFDRRVHRVRNHVAEARGVYCHRAGAGHARRESDDPGPGERIQLNVAAGCLNGRIIDVGRNRVCDHVAREHAVYRHAAGPRHADHDRQNVAVKVNRRIRKIPVQFRDLVGHPGEAVRRPCGPGVEVDGISR